MLYCMMSLMVMRSGGACLEQQVAVEALGLHISSIKYIIRFNRITLLPIDKPTTPNIGADGVNWYRSLKLPIANHRGYQLP